MYTRLIDLTHAVTPDIPTWSGRCGFEHATIMDYDQGVRVMKYKLSGACGTHMDAPSHFIKGGCDIAHIPLEQLVVPLHVIDLRPKIHPNLFIQPHDIKIYGEKHGKIMANSLVVAFTGWQQYWSDPVRYRGEDEKGRKHFPGFSKEAAEYLLEREVAGIGIDTLSPDGSNQDDFPVHWAILGAGKYIIENLNNLDQVPSTGAWAVSFPTKISEGAEAPLRCAALVT
ncbi:MAG: cyclase family protein [Chlamydiales bacterium]|nr:cyclase family protein [Chlamydiales bacterium]